MASESSIVAAIKRRAKDAGWWVEKRHGGPFSLAGMPDLQFHKPLNPGSPASVTVYIEVKQPGKKPTAVQHRRMEELRRYGVHVGWVTSADAAMDLLRSVDPAVPRRRCIERRAAP